MNAELKAAKQEIRQWIKQWDDQKLAHVYLHNLSGKMNLMDPCGCILGVTLAETVHTNYDVCDFAAHYHYNEALRLPRAASAERAYEMLGWDFGQARSGWHIGRRKRLSPILKAEMRRRDRLANLMVASKDELVLA